MLLIYSHVLRASLILCNMHDGCFQSLMQFGNLNTHLASQLSIQVGQRLVHQEYLWATNDSTSHVAGNGVNSNLFMRAAIENRVI